MHGWTELTSVFKSPLAIRALAVILAALIAGGSTLTVAPERAIAEPGSASDGGTAQEPQVSAESRVMRARELYLLAGYDEIVQTLTPISPDQLEALDPALRLDVHRLLGLAQILKPQPDPEAAYAAFLALLRLDPRFQFLDGITPQEAIAVLDRVRADHPELAPKDPVGPGDGVGVVYIEREVIQNRFWMVFLPPLGQFQNGDELTGFLLLAIEGLALTTNIGSFAIVESLRDANGFFSPANKAAAESFQTAQLVALGVLAVTVGYGIGQAWANFSDQQVRIRKLDGPPPEFGLRDDGFPTLDLATVRSPDPPGCGGCASGGVSGMLLRALWSF